MKRRAFLKLSAVAGTSLMIPSMTEAADIDLSKVRFNSATYQKNKPQVIMIFLYGGPSELAGNLTNIEAIEKASQSKYAQYFRGVTPTANHFWQEAGGTFMESLLASGDLNLFRTCYSRVREENNNKSHGRCVSQNQRGRFIGEGAGIFTTLGQILQREGIIGKDTMLPFVTMEGESGFYGKGDRTVAGFLSPVGMGKDLDNPYARGGIHRWYYYTPQEREIPGYDKNTTAALHEKMDSLAQSLNEEGEIKEAFAKRGTLEQFIDWIKTRPLPAGVVYPESNSFGAKLQTAVRILSANPDTKVVSLGNDGLGGWDDHNDARNYVTRMEKLFSALSAAMTHIKAEGKENEISIMVFGDFGRNVNLNSALGWDHGNNQNFYLLGGKNYFRSVGIVGETELYDPNRLNRLYLRPKTGSYWFEPLSIAATVYKIFGIENPEVLTEGYGAIDGGLFV